MRLIVKSDKGKGGAGGAAGKGLGALFGANKREPEAEDEDIERRHHKGKGGAAGGAGGGAGKGLAALFGGN